MKTQVAETSRIAYEQIKPELSKRQKEVYDFIEKNPFNTNTEISIALQLPINCITGRTRELVKQKLVYSPFKRMCKHTGKLCMTWHVDNRPKGQLNLI